jgi:SAM-dependent methyltransferase
MQSHPSRIEAIYLRHPLRAETILARVGGLREGQGSITEADLATDPTGRITDQNHPGGALLVRLLAREAGVEPGCRVLDVGCGLGGPARLLAQEFGARVDGVELTATRYRDAVRLTQLVGLDGQVRIMHGDFLTLDLPARHYDVAWGQAAWVHFPDLGAVFARCAAVLRPGGRVAVEEAYLRGRPQTPDVSRRLGELEGHWAAHFNDRDSWLGAAERQGFNTTCLADLTAVMLEEFVALRKAATLGPAGAVNPDEVRGWELVCALIQEGIVGYLRLVARLGEVRAEPPTNSGSQ